MAPRHLLLVLLVVVVWGVNFVVIDVGLDHFPPLLLAALRFALVAIPGVFLVHRPAVPWRWLLAFGLSLGVGYFGLLFLGMAAGMPAGLSSLVLQSQAIFTQLLAVLLLHERLRRLNVLGTLIAFAGLVVIALGISGTVPLLALLLVITSAACWGLSNVVSRIAQAPNGLGLVIWSSIVPPIPLAFLSMAVEGPDRIALAMSSVNLTSLAALAYLVILATLFGFGVWNALLRRYPAGVVAPFSLLVPVVGISAAWLLRAEHVPLSVVIGSIVVLSGLALSISSSLQPERVAQPALMKGHVRI